MRRHLAWPKPGAWTMPKYKQCFSAVKKPGLIVTLKNLTAYYYSERHRKKYRRKQYLHLQTVCYFKPARVAGHVPFAVTAAAYIAAIAARS